MSSYILRDLPEDLWTRVKTRAAGEGRDLQTVLLALLERYADGGVPEGGRAVRSAYILQLGHARTFGRAAGLGEEPCEYDIAGLPPGERALVSRTAHSPDWGILRWHEGELHSGKPRGHYPSADEALAALQIAIDEGRQVGAVVVVPFRCVECRRRFEVDCYHPGDSGMVSHHLKCPHCGHERLAVLPGDVAAITRTGLVE